MTFVVNAVWGYGAWSAWAVSNILHATGGAFAFVFLRAVWRATEPYHETQIKSWMKIIIFVSGALVMGVLWEWYEFLWDRYYVWIKGRHSLMMYLDTIGDLMLDTVGALIAAAIYKKRIYEEKSE